MAKEAGANVVGGSSIIESITNGSLPVNFDRALATPDIMPSLSKVARILGPRGLMPNAKLNTIQPPGKMRDAIIAQTSGMVQYRTDKNGNIMAGIGKGSFDKVSTKQYYYCTSFFVMNLETTCTCIGNLKSTNQNCSNVCDNK